MGYGAKVALGLGPLQARWMEPPFELTDACFGLTKIYVLLEKCGLKKIGKTHP